MAIDERTRREVESVLGRQLTRRDVLRIAAYGGGAVGAAAFLAACGPGATAAPSTAASPSVGASTSPSSAASPSAAVGRTIKIGYVTPTTGVLADFAAADDYVLGGIREALAGGIVNNGTTHPIEILVKDSQSLPNRSAEVALELITDDEIDLMLIANTPETTNPAADQCEANGVPCVSTVTPWQPYFLGRQPAGTAPPDAQPFEWTYHFFWGLEDVISVFSDMWTQVENNKIVGGLFPNDGDGLAWSDSVVGFPATLEPAGYTMVIPPLFETGADSFTSQITAFKEANVQILTGVPVPPDFTNFWNEAAQQGFKPKIASVGKALLFPAAINALGDLGEGLSTEVWWSPSHPFRSSLTRASAKELADGYTAATQNQWTQPIGFAHAVFEVGADVLSRATSIDDPAAIRDAIKATVLETIVGRVAWDGADLPPFATTNIAKTPLVGGQWKKGTTFDYDLVIVSNKDHPDIPSGGTLDPIPGT